MNGLPVISQGRGACFRRIRHCGMQKSVGAFLNGFSGLLQIFTDSGDGVASRQRQTQQQQYKPFFHGYFLLLFQ
jgi:hypothetical protein